FDADDLHFIGTPACRIAHHVGGDNRGLAGEPRPILRTAKWPLNPRRRHLENVSPASKIFRVQPRFDRARRGRAIFDRDLFAVPAFDADVDNRTTLASPDLEFEKL